ncbi:MAG: 4-phosphoerythronate dehydrogenase, partial [Bacteroidales bacterium]|nr:4-phosphoerythronate dehydrogenase [Bacteroidales bacterium]
MKHPVIIIDDHIPFIKGILEPFARVTYAPGGVIDKDIAFKADGLLIRTRTRCNAELLDGSPVKFIASATIGTDHIDIQYCNDQSIEWHHAPGCNSGSVMQYLASALSKLSTIHQISLEGKTIGIIGAGNVGKKIALLATSLGMNPLLNDPPRARIEGQQGFVALQKIKEECDLITFHVPLNLEGDDRTFHLADDAFFNSLNKKPLIINTSRGAVVDSSALKAAHKKGMIRGFVSDVWEDEPHIDRELLAIADIATPHIAGYSVEGKANGTVAVVRAASRFFGFGLDYWYPENIPGPEKPVIEITSAGRSDERIIVEAILGTYDVLKDDRTLRNDPLQFEYLRNYYPVRREFSAYTLHTKGLNHELRLKLNHLGFVCV